MTTIQTKLTVLCIPTSQLRSDAIAGLTVGMMVVPQALAYARVAGLEPEVVWNDLETYALKLWICCLNGILKLVEVIIPYNVFYYLFIHFIRGILLVLILLLLLLFFDWISGASWPTLWLWNVVWSVFLFSWMFCIRISRYSKGCNSRTYSYNVTDNSGQFRPGSNFTGRCSFHFFFFFQFYVSFPCMFLGYFYFCFIFNLKFGMIIEIQ